MIIGRLVILRDHRHAEVLDSSWCDAGIWWLGVMLQDGSLLTVEADTVQVVPSGEMPS